MTQTTTRTRGRLLPLVALGIAATAAIGATAAGFPAITPAHAAPGDVTPGEGFEPEAETQAISLSVELPADGSNLEFPLITGVQIAEPGATVHLPDGFSVDANGNLVLTASTGGTWESGGTTTVNYVIGDDPSVVSTVAISGVMPEEEPTEEPTSGPVDAGNLMGIVSPWDAACTPGTLTIPLGGSAAGSGFTWDDPDVTVPYASGVDLAEDGTSLTLTGYDPAGRMGTARTLAAELTGTNVDGPAAEADLWADLGMWCGTDGAMQAAGDGTYEFLPRDLFSNLLYEDGFVVGGLTGAIVLEALPNVGTLTAYDAGGNAVAPDATRSARYGGVAYAPTVTRFVYDPEGADPSGYEVRMTIADLKAVASAPVTVTFEPVEPTPEEPEPTPEPETPTPEVEVPRVSE